MRIVMSIALAALLCVQGVASTAGPPPKKSEHNLPPPKVEKKPENPKDVNAEYKEIIRRAADYTKGVTKEAFYKDFVFKNKKTGEKKKIGELPAFDRDSFYLHQIERLNDEVAKAKAAWASQFNAHDKLPEEKKKELPAKDDLEYYTEQMHFWHRKLSDKHKAHAEYLFKTYKDEFTKEEVAAYMKKLAEYRKENKLGE